MIVGVIGVPGSGKDLFGRIWQLLDCWNNQRIFESNYLDLFDEEKIKFKDDEVSFVMEMLSKNDLHYIEGYTSWEIHKFANHLKDIVCLLFGCEKSDLESNTFKNSYVPMEWKMVVDGKETVPTYRQVLQKIGTECFRDNFNPKTWILSLFSQYKLKKNLFIDNIPSPWYYPNWLITDVRFNNEVDAIVEKEGIIIKIEREGYKIKGYENHASETFAKTFDEYDFKIYNNGTIEEFIKYIKILMLGLGVIVEKKNK
jgi:hypothetical protein